MKKKLVRCSLPAAIFAACMGFSGTVLAEGDVGVGAPIASATLVSFAGAALSVDSAASNGGGKVLKGESLSVAEVGRLSDETTGNVVAVLASNTLPLSGDGEAILRRLVRAQVPVLVRMDGHAEADRQNVANLLGIVPSAAVALVRRDASGETAVFSPGEDAGEADGDVLHSLRKALMDSVAEDAEPDEMMQSKGRSSMQDDGKSPPEVPFAPMRRYKFNLVRNDGGIGGFAKVEVVRAITRAGDRKVITVTSETDFKPFHGYKFADTPRIEFWLPTQYGISHSVRVGNGPVDNAGYLPKSDDRTTFDYSDSSTDSRTIGGSAGAEVSTSGKPDEKLGAKLSFSGSLSYTKSRTRALSMKFTDFSLAATSAQPGTVSWTADMAPRAYHHVISGGGTGGLFWNFKHGSHHVLNAMTPMMKTAYMAGESTWSVSGSEEGFASVALLAHYSSDNFYFPRAPQVKRYSSSVAAGGDIPLSDPYLTREITVLISSWSNGQCMADVLGQAQLLECDSEDRRQMWRLDTKDRYVNHASRRCLTGSAGEAPVLVDTCKENANNQRWRWLADRLHLMRGGTRGDRLHVKAGAIQSSVPSAGIESYPVNSHAAVLNPWPSYPSPPFPGELIPAPAHIKVGTPIHPSWVDLPEVDDRQRWDIQPLRHGLQPEDEQEVRAKGMRNRPVRN